ncbi:MAG: hypothetical protein FWG66_08485 [Spirochaetes bacterium]|nr:hypothetical protein [Spirochaetota bacterium]
MADDLHKLFAERIKTRIERYEDDNLSEDCIRYEYFNALLETEKRKTCDLVLEYPHPHPKLKSERRKIDCVIMDKQNKPIQAVEFKYFPPRSNHAASPEGMGSIFADCYRLLLTKIPHKTIVIVSLGNMTHYINNPKHGFDFLFASSADRKRIPIKKTFLDNIKSKGFHKTIEGKVYQDFSPFDFSLKRVFKDDCNSADNVIAIFDVLKG